MRADSVEIAGTAVLAACKKNEEMREFPVDTGGFVQMMSHCQSEADYTQFA